MSTENLMCSDLSSERGLGQLITICWTVPPCEKFLWEHFLPLRERGRLWTCPSLKMRKFLDIEQLHSAWVADAASFHSG